MFIVLVIDRSDETSSHTNYIVKLCVTVLLEDIYIPDENSDFFLKRK